MEMLLHHFISAMLLVMCYVTNMYRTGLLIYYLHNIADIPGHLAKILVETKKTVLALTVYVFMVIIWGITRNIFFPYMIYVIGWAKGPELINRMAKHGTYFLMVLVLMHYYWLYIFYKIG